MFGRVGDGSQNEATTYRVWFLVSATRVSQRQSAVDFPGRKTELDKGKAFYPSCKVHVSVGFGHFA